MFGEMRMLPYFVTVFAIILLGYSILAVFSLADVHDLKTFLA